MQNENFLWRLCYINLSETNETKRKYDRRGGNEKYERHKDTQQPKRHENCS